MFFSDRDEVLTTDGTGLLSIRCLITGKCLCTVNDDGTDRLNAFFHRVATFTQTIIATPRSASLGDCRLRVWNRSDGELILDLPIFTYCLRAKGSLLVARYYGSIYVWDFSKGQDRVEITVGGSPVDTVDLDVESRTVLIAAGGDVLFVDLETRQCVKVIERREIMYRRAMPFDTEDLFFAPLPWNRDVDGRPIADEDAIEIKFRESLGPGFSENRKRSLPPRFFIAEFNIWSTGVWDLAFGTVVRSLSWEGRNHKMRQMRPLPLTSHGLSTVHIDRVDTSVEVWNFARGTQKVYQNQPRYRQLAILSDNCAYIAYTTTRFRRKDFEVRDFRRSEGDEG